MGFFGKLLDATLNTALLPIDMAKDFVTLGGLDQEEPHTFTRVKKICEKVEDAGEDASEGDFL